MKIKGKWKAVMLSLALLGMMAATPLTTNAAEPVNPFLHKGMHNTDVIPLQIQLKKLDYYHFYIDGIFGPLTFKAVKGFQKDNGLRTDGIVGPKTKKALDKEKSLKHTYKKAPLLHQGSHGKVVKDLQTQLHHLNYYDGDLDGIYGPLTEKAVKAFQKANHIAVDGVVGPKTYAALIHNPVQGREKDNQDSMSDHSSKKEVVESISTGPDKSVEKKGNQNSDQNNTGQNNDQDNVKTLYVESTAYTAHCSGCSGVTATGINLLKNPDSKVIAVDPSVIPLGSKVWVQGYGYAVAGDTGGAIDGKRIDVFMPSQSKAMNWGRKTVKVKVFN
ncbi:MAG TPA: peptidoglycan-binding protein [Bacillales bacterium]|nr:peptidoglycan-binding protein [Bacillales bacterium]